MEEQQAVDEKIRLDKLVYNIAIKIFEQRIADINRSDQVQFTRQVNQLRRQQLLKRNDAVCVNDDGPYGNYRCDENYLMEIREGVKKHRDLLQRYADQAIVDIRELIDPTPRYY